MREEIARCRDEDCPSSKKCRRFVMEVEIGESYFTVSPRGTGWDRCEMFLPVPASLSDRLKSIDKVS